MLFVYSFSGIVGPLAYVTPQARSVQSGCAPGGEQTELDGKPPGARRLGSVDFQS